MSVLPVPRPTDEPLAWMTRGTIVMRQFPGRVLIGRRAIVEQLAADQDLAPRHELLVSIPGIDTVTAATILIKLPDIRILRAPAK